MKFVKGERVHLINCEIDTTDPVSLWRTWFTEMPQSLSDWTLATT